LIYLDDLGKIACNNILKKMSDKIRIKNALISVFDKNGLEEIVKQLSDFNIDLYSTGGTEKFIKDLDIKVNKIEDLTTYPSILGGRVKTLHPNIFGGILARRDNTKDQEQLKKYDIPRI
jgi:phosphoribosylaminoimidazolecarboxamide formyltransferase/IMP cyclohydrolase